MLRPHWFIFALCLLLAAALPAQQALNNESVVKLVKAGLSEEMIVNMVNTQPGNYNLGADGVIALKTAGVPEKVLVAMMQKGSGVASVAPAPAAAPQIAAAPAGTPNEIGVYFKKGEQWVEVLPYVYRGSGGPALFFLRI